MLDKVEWDKSGRALERIRSEFVRMHDIGDKNWTIEQRGYVAHLRQRCREIGDHRYWLLRNKK